MKPELVMPLETAPVSVYAPFTRHPFGGYRDENTAQRRTALLTPLNGVQLGAYDQRIVGLAGRVGRAHSGRAGVVVVGVRAVAVAGHVGGGEPR